MNRMRFRQLVWLIAGLTAMLVALPSSGQEADPKLTIESLLKEGWLVAGYTGAVDNWSAFILLRHPTETFLVQCRAGYDVMREPRVQTNCYRLR